MDITFISRHCDHTAYPSICLFPLFLIFHYKGNETPKICPMTFFSFLTSDNEVIHSHIKFQRCFFTSQWDIALFVYTYRRKQRHLQSILDLFGHISEMILQLLYHERADQLTKEIFYNRMILTRFVSETSR